MSAVEKLQNIQSKNKSIICLGLDLDPRRMPPENTKSIKGMYDFVMNIVEATKDMVCAYKPNLAFYENKGAEGLSLLASIAQHIPEDVVIIMDGKRGDIGNTASFYAEAMYRRWNADWVTLNPYMGYDALRPFLEYEDKGIFVLCLTSNTGSKDFQHLMIEGKPLYQVVAEKVDYWNKANNCGLVVGATHPDQLKELRSIAANMPLLIPGVGAQGGSLEKAAVYGTDNFQKLAVINVCRSVLYASTGSDYAERAREELKKLNDIVSGLRSGDIRIEDTEPTAVPPDIQSQSEQPQQQSPQPESQPEPAREEPKPEPPREEVKSEPEPQPEPPQESKTEPEPEPPKKEWKLPPIPDLPFVKKREDQQKPPEDRNDGQAAQSPQQNQERRDHDSQRPDGQHGEGDPPEGQRRQDGQPERQNFQRRYDNRNFKNRSRRNRKNRNNQNRNINKNR